MDQGLNWGFIKLESTPGIQQTGTQEMGALGGDPI